MVRKSKVTPKKIKVPEPPKPETVKLHVLYSQTSEGGDPESDEPYSNRSDENTSTTFRGAVVGDVSSFRWNHQTFEVPKEAFASPRDRVFAVVGYYTDGDTFGTSYGNMHIVEVCGNIEHAHALARALEAEDRAERKERNPSIFGGSKRYVPWGGYFNRLERIEVEVLNILSISADPDDSGEKARLDGPIPDPDNFPKW